MAAMATTSLDGYIGPGAGNGDERDMLFGGSGDDMLSDKVNQ